MELQIKKLGWLLMLVFAISFSANAQDPDPLDPLSEPVTVDPNVDPNAVSLPPGAATSSVVDPNAKTEDLSDCLTAPE